MKRTKSRRNRRRSSTMNANKGAINGLVTSMKKNVKFKGLLKYTVGCIAELVTPPNPAVSDNAHALRKSGGIEILIQALKNHQGDEELLAFVAATLEKCGVDSSMIKHMGKCGAAKAVLAPLEANPHFVEGRVAAVRLVKKIAQVEDTLSDLVSQGVTQSVLGVLGTASSLKNGDIDIGILTDASTTLGSLVNHEDAINSLMNEHDVGVLIGVLGSDAAKCRDVASKFLKPVFRVLQKIGSTPEGIALIKRLGGVDSLLAAMEANPDDLSLLKAGASVLDKLVSVKDLEEALRILADASSSERAKQLAAAMVGNLALTGDNLETITNAGGLQSLLAVLEAAESPALIEAAARALGRLATTVANVEALIASGGILKLLDLIRNNVDCDGVVSAVDGALTNIAHFMHGATAIDDANGILVVVWALECHPEFSLAPHSAVRFFNMIMRTLGTRGGETLLKDNMIPHVGAALKAGSENESLAASGAACFRTIITLLGCADKVVDAGAIQTSIDALTRFSASAFTAIPVLQLLYSLSFEQSFRTLMVEGGVIAPTVRVAKQHVEDSRVVHAVVELLSRIVDENEIQKAISMVSTQATNVASGKVSGAESLEALILSVVKIECYSMIPKCVSSLLSNNAIEAVVKMLSSTTSARPDDVFKQGSIFEAIFECLQTLAKSERRANTAVSDLSSRTVSEVLKKFTELPDALSEAAELVCTLATLPANVPTLQSSSISKCLIGAAKSNPSHVQLQRRVAKALTLMAINSDIANIITRSGAARVLLASCSDMDGCDSPSARCVEVVLRMVGTLSDFAGSLKTLQEQSIITQLCSVTHKFGWNPEVSAAARRPLTLLHSDTQIEQMMVENTHEIELDLSVAQMASAFCLVEAVAEAHSQTCADAFNQVIEGCTPSEERYLQASAATLGLSWLANDLHLNERQDVVPTVVTSLENWTLSRELTCRSLIAVSSMAGNPDSTGTLLDAGVVPAIVNSMSKLGHEDVVSLAGTRALDALCKTPQGCGNVVYRGGLDVIKRELDACHSEERMEATLHLVETICGSEDSDSARQIMESSDILPLLVTGMEAFPHSLAVQSASVKALVAMTQASPGADATDSQWKCALLMKAKGLVEVLTAVLDEETTDRADVVVNALRVVSAIVTSNSELAQQCKEKGVDNSVLNAMTRYPTHTSILQDAAVALRPMTSSSDVTTLIEQISPSIPAVQNDDQRIATSVGRLLRKLANLSYVDGIMENVDVPSIATILLEALTAGDALTDEDVRGPYLGACVGAMAGLANCGNLAEQELVPLVAAVVEHLRTALATPGAETAVLQCTTSCALMAGSVDAARLMVAAPHHLTALNMQVLDNAGNDKYLAFAGLTLLRRLASVDGDKVSEARAVEQCVSLMRQHFDAYGVLLAGVDMLEALVASFPYAPMVSEGGIAVALDVTESAYTKRQQELMSHVLQLLSTTVSALPANQSTLGSDEAISTLKHVFVGALTSANMVTMEEDINVMSGVIKGDVGDPAVSKMLNVGMHDLVMKAMSMHPEHEDFVAAGLAFLSSLLERDEGQRAIDKAAAEELFAQLRDVHGNSSAVGQALELLTEKLTERKVATDEMVIEAIRTYASYYPHLASRPDLGSHLEKLAADLATYAKTDRHADLIQQDDGVEVFVGGLTAMCDGAEDFAEQENILSRSTDALGRIERKRPGYVPIGRPEIVERCCVHFRTKYDAAELSEATMVSGLDLVVDATKRHPDQSGLQKHAATLLSILAQCGVPGVGEKLFELGCVDMLIAQLQEEGQSPELLSLRLAALNAMVKNVEGAAQAVVDGGGIAAITTAMWNNNSSADVVAAGMSLLSSCNTTNGFAEAMRACNGIDIVLALMTTHAFDERVASAAASILAVTCSTEDVNACLTSLRATIDANDSTGTADLLNRLANLMSIDVLHEDSELIGRVAALVQEAMRAFPDSDAVNNAGLRVLAEIAAHDNTFAQQFLNDGTTFNYAFDVLKTDPTNISRMLPALIMLGACASNAKVAQNMVDNGAIGALLNAIRMNPNNPAVQCRSVDVLRALGESLGASKFIEQGGLKALLEALEVANKHQTASLASRVLDSLAILSTAEKEFADAFLNSHGMTLLSETMEVFSNDEDVLSKIAKLMKVLAEVTGKIEKILSSQQYKDLVKIMGMHPELLDFSMECLKFMSLAIGDPKLLDILAQTGSIAAVQAMLGLHADCAPLVAACDAIMDASGNADFENLTAGEATDQLRQAVASGASGDIASALKAIGQLAVLDSAAKSEMVEGLGTFDDVIGIVAGMDPPFDMKIMNAAVGAMSQMPMNDMIVKMLLETNSIAKLLEAMRQAPNDTELLLKVVRVLGKMSVNDDLKQAIVDAGGIELVLWCMGAHQSHALLMGACCTALANFAFNSSEIATQIVQKDGIPIVENVMQVNEAEDRVLANSLQVLSNLMFKNDEHKKLICAACGDEIVHMMRTHFSNVGVFQSGLRALGTLVYCEENCPIIVGEGATRVIVDGMRLHWEDPDTVQLGINVLENLAAENVPVSEAPDSVGKAHHPTRHGEDSLQVIHAEGGTNIILKSIEHFEYNPSLIMSSIDALLNVVEDENLMDTIIRDGAIPIIMEALRAHDWDQELVGSILNLLVAMSNRSSEISLKIERSGGIELCCAAMDNFNDSREIVTQACMLLTNIGNAEEKAVEKMGQQGIVDVLLSIIAEKSSDANFVMEPIHTLAILTGNKLISKQIASKGMHSLCSIAKTHMSNGELLGSVHKLIGFLAFTPACLRDIVQHDGPCMIIESICNNPESRDMVLQAVSTIDVICMSDAEHRDICVNEGAEECVQVVMDTYSHDQKIVDACQSTLLSIRVNAKSQPMKAQLTQKFSSGRLRAQSINSELEDLKRKVDSFRNKILSGNMMTKHHKSNNPRKRHIVITSDLRMIGWKEVSMKGSFKGTLQLSEVTAVEAGPVTPSLRRRYFMGTNPKGPCCFAVHARTRTLDLECQSESQRDEWVEMLTVLIKYRKIANLR